MAEAEPFVDRVKQQADIVRVVAEYLGSKNQHHVVKRERIEREMEKWRSFLLLGVGFCVSSSSRDDNPGRRPPRIVASVSSLGVEVRPVLLLEQSQRKRFLREIWRWAGRGRLLLVARKGRTADIVARKVADALFSLYPLFHGLRPLRPFTPYRVPEHIVKKRGILEQDLVKVEQSVGRYSDQTFFQAELGATIVVPEKVMAHIFFYLPVVLASEPLFNAAQFFQHAVSDHEFVADDITEVFAEPDAGPESEADRVGLENLILNSFRAVEALAGKPGRNEDRFRTRLRNSGIDPDEAVGFEGQPRQSIAGRTRWLSNLRDETAAHGRRRPEPVTFREAMEAQYLARTIVRRAIVYTASLRGRADGTAAERRYLLRQMFGIEDLTRVGRVLKCAPEALVTEPGGLKGILAALQDIRRRDTYLQQEA